MESIEMKFGHVFMDGEDQYLFIKILGSGLYATAQLVLQVQTGELVVRKVDKRLFDELEKQEEDPERILFQVQSQARQRGLQPNVSHLYSADDKPAPQRRGGRELLYHRVRYFKFYNGGTLSEFWQACETRDIAPPPSLILTMIRDVIQALHFMYSMKPYFVMHGDLHRGNIFLHWEQNASGGPRFFLGDFGRSTCGSIRAGNRFGLIADIRQVGLHTQTLLCAGTNYDFQSGLGQYLEAVVEPELLRLARGPATQLPDLTRLLELLSAAPTDTPSPPDMLPFKFTGESRSIPSPLLYDTWEEARKARDIHGPWHIGQVSINPSTGKLTIVSTSTQTYHRPIVPDSASDDTDSEDGYSPMV
ncbi:hypothetical protein F5883DRAFT_516390 [Diaporthe sp. PMI_573]|nr:hypothetical protein F5883DRAFT_516390 [Diaporthaceae sp. PMI_573]